MTEPVTTSNRGKIYEYYKDSSRTMRKAAEIAVENNNASVDSEGNVRLDLNGAESIVKDHFKYIPKVFFGTVIEELDEADQDAICIIEEYDEDDFEEVELNEIGEQHEREVIRTKVQVQDLGSRTTANLTAKWTCQKGHVSEIRYPRWVEELEHPSQCFGVEEDEEECFDTPTKRVKNSGLKTDVQQLVLGEIDKDDRSSRNVISEVDDPFIGELDRRDKVEVIGRVMMADRQNESKIQPYIHILGYEPIGHNIELTTEKMDELEDIENESEDIVSDVVDSVAPEIVDKQGQRLFKKACVLSVLRGANHTDRNMIHSLGYGEKGSGKSKIMEFIEEVTEDSKFSDMQNATGPGLTATAKETSKLQGEGSQWIITSGMIPQTHGSVALLDELDKMDERDQTLISTPMS